MTRRAFAHYIALMSETEKLLREIEAFLKSAKISATTFGRKTVNDGKLVPRLRSGGSVTLDKAAHIRRCIAAMTAPDQRRAS